MEYIFGLERVIKVVGTDRLVIQEPTIQQLADWERAYNHTAGLEAENVALDAEYMNKVVEQARTIKSLEPLTQDHYDAVNQAYKDLTTRAVIDMPSKDGTKIRTAIADLSVLQELELVACRYGTSPFTLAREVTVRQLHYIYTLAYNGALEDVELKIALAGGKSKRKAPRLHLINADLPEDTAGMSVEDKAKHFAKQIVRERENNTP